MSRFAEGIPDLQLDDYQRAVRLLLSHPFVNAQFPDDKAMGRVMRFWPTLQTDFADAFGYRLEAHGDTVRLLRVRDRLDATQPALTVGGSKKPFDRRRYAYLCLVLAALGRAGGQTVLSELAATVADDAHRIESLGFEEDSYRHRCEFLDAVAWLEKRGVLRTADGSSAGWASDPEGAEALYDIDRDALTALFRPARSLQSIGSAADLLHRAATDSGNEQRRLASQAARRAVCETPVAYFRDFPDEVVNHLKGAALAEDLERLTGLRPERRAEGVMLVDTARFSAEAFPGVKAVAQAAIGLLVECCDRVVDPDRRTRRIPLPPDTDHTDLMAAIDQALPRQSTIALPDEEAAASVAEPVESEDGVPFFSSAALLKTVKEAVLGAYPKSFGAAWHADPARLCDEAVALLERFGLMRRVDGGAVLLELAGRYRNTVLAAKPRQRTLF